MGETTVAEQRADGAPDRRQYSMLVSQRATHWHWRSWAAGLLVTALVTACIVASASSPRWGGAAAAREAGAGAFLVAAERKVPASAKPAHAAGPAKHGELAEHSERGGVEACSVPGENCLKSQCCTNPGMGCFMKDEGFATCHPSCVPGKVDKHDKGKFKEPWNCTLLGKPPVTTTTRAPPSNAGCLIEDSGKILVVRHAWGVLDIPGGTTDPGETPQETAARETWEETGYKVKVHGLKEVTGNGFHIYHCTLLPPYHRQGSPDPHEVAAVIWLPKKAMWSSGNWRFPDEVGSFE